MHACPALHRMVNGMVSDSSIIRLTGKHTEEDRGEGDIKHCCRKPRCESEHLHSPAELGFVLCVVVRGIKSIEEAEGNGDDGNDEYSPKPTRIVGTLHRKPKIEHLSECSKPICQYAVPGEVDGGAEGEIAKLNPLHNREKVNH